MKQNILWKGIENDSLENCMVNFTNEGSVINSTIIGKGQDLIYKVVYHIKTNQLWETTYLEIEFQLGDNIKTVRFRSDGKGNWTTNGKPVEAFNGCIDVDITLTPFTNSLPINRLKLAVNEVKQIKVLYLNVLNQEISSVYQKYTRLSANEYKFETVPNDFEAIIETDELGLVVSYPQLFRRLLITE